MRTHTILHTFINRHGKLESDINCGFNGASDEDARNVFDSHVRFAEDAWLTGDTWNGTPIRITAIMLVDANDKVLGEWHHEPAMAGAA